MKKVITTGGGTGGHLYPAVAILECLKKEGLEIGHIGHPKKIEAEKIPALGIPFYPISFSGMPTNKLLLPFWLLQLFFSSLQAIQLLNKLKPNLIYATGGYVTAPILLAAKILNIPYILHEPDAHPGKVNKLFSNSAVAITAGFEAAKKVLANKNFVATGNPLRKSIGQTSKKESLKSLELNWPQDSQVLLVVGGSLGAHSINQAILNCASNLFSQFPNLFILHQTGVKNFEQAQALYKKNHLESNKYQLLPYIENMPAVLNISSLVVARAGALSLSEFAVSGLPTLLIPYPYAAGNHQYYNAKSFQEAGASEVILDKDLTSEILEKQLVTLLKSPEKLMTMAQSAKALGKPNASQIITQLTLSHL